MAVEKFRPSDFNEAVSHTIKALEWHLNKCFEYLCWVPIKDNNYPDRYNRYYDISDVQKEIFHKLHKEFAKRHPIKVLFNETDEFIEKVLDGTNIEPLK